MSYWIQPVKRRPSLPSFLPPSLFPCLSSSPASLPLSPPLVYCALCIVHGVLCIVYCALCTVHCVLCIVYWALCTVHCVLCIVYCALCTVHFIQCIVYCALFIVYCALSVAVWVPGAGLGVTGAGFGKTCMNWNWKNCFDKTVTKLILGGLGAQGPRPPKNAVIKPVGGRGGRHWCQWQVTYALYTVQCVLSIVYCAL